MTGGGGLHQRRRAIVGLSVHSRTSLDQKLDKFKRLIATGHGVTEQRDPMRSAHAMNVGHGLKHGANDAGHTQHRGSKHVEPSTVFEKKFGDVSSSHVGCTPQAGFEISLAPVPAGVHKLRFALEHRSDGVEIEMGFADELADQLIRNRQWLIVSPDLLREYRRRDRSPGRHDKAIKAATPLNGIVSIDDSLTKVQRIFDNGEVAVLIENGNLTGIIAKIDVVEFLAAKS